MEFHVTMNLPPEVESQLQGDDPALTAVAREAVAVDLFRSATRMWTPTDGVSMS